MVSPPHGFTDHTHPHVETLEGVDMGVCVCHSALQVYCNVPPSEAEQDLKLMEEAVATECCPEMLRRVKDGAKVVCMMT